MSPIRSVCVYCGSSSQVDDRYKQAAHTVGERLAQAGLRVVYGGGRVGLMGIVADAALAAGGEVVGIIPTHIQVLEVDHTGLTELHVVDSMHTRKRMMVERSDAFVVLPGGLGTLDETFEVITWRQLKLHDKPIVIVDVDGYWAPLRDLLDHIVQTGFGRGNIADLYSVVADPDAMMAELARLPTPSTPPRSERL